MENCRWTDPYCKDLPQKAAFTSGHFPFSAQPTTRQGTTPKPYEGSAAPPVGSYAAYGERKLKRRMALTSRFAPQTIICRKTAAPRIG